MLSPGDAEEFVPAVSYSTVVPPALKLMTAIKAEAPAAPLRFQVPIKGSWFCAGAAIDESSVKAETASIDARVSLFILTFLLREFEWDFLSLLRETGALYIALRDFATLTCLRCHGSHLPFSPAHTHRGVESTPQLRH